MASVAPGVFDATGRYPRAGCAASAAGTAIVWLRGRYPGYRSFLTTITTLRDFPATPRTGRSHALGG